MSFSHIHTLSVSPWLFRLWAYFFAVGGAEGVFSRGGLHSGSVWGGAGSSRRFPCHLHVACPPTSSEGRQDAYDSCGPCTHMFSTLLHITASMNATQITAATATMRVSVIWCDRRCLQSFASVYGFVHIYISMSLHFNHWIYCIYIYLSIIEPI